MTTRDACLQTLHAVLSLAANTMPLSRRHPFPPSRAFVVKFHDDCHPAGGSWHGRVEHMASGRQREFDSADELLVGLAAMTPRANDDAAGGDPVPQPTQRGDANE